MATLAVHPVAPVAAHPRTVSDLLTLYEQEYLPHQARTTQKHKRFFFKHLARDLRHIPLAELTPSNSRRPVKASIHRAYPLVCS